MPTPTRAPYDAQKPAQPAWHGTRRAAGARIVAGRDHVADAITELLDRGEPLGLDIENCGVTPPGIYMVKLVTVGTREMVVALDPRDPLQAEQVRRVTHHAGQLIVHNAPFDVPVLVALGLAPADVVERTLDTLVLARMAQPGQGGNSLEQLVEKFLGLQVLDLGQSYKAAGMATKGEWYSTGDIDIFLYLQSAALDTAVLPPLYVQLHAAAVALLTTGHPFASKSLDAYGATKEIERQQIVNRVMLRASCRGLQLDYDYHAEYLDKHVAAMEADARGLEAVGITPGNSSDLIRVVSEMGNLPRGWPKTPTGALRARAADIEGLLAGNPIGERFLRHKRRDKTLRDYLEKLADYEGPDGRVRPQVAILGAGATGRMAASTPPYQQFPGDARPMVRADDEGGWASIDWSAIEPLVAGYTAGQQDLVTAITSGEDTYVPVGRAAGLIPAGLDDAQARQHPGRDQAKVVMLGLFYGKGAKLLAQELGTSTDQAESIKRKVLGAIPQIGSWMDTLRVSAEQIGQTITAAGRVVPVAKRPDGPGYKGYLAQNYYHQGSAYDCLADALVELHRQGEADVIRLAVHDELVVRADAAQDVAQVMQRATGSLERFTGLSGLYLPTDMNPLPDTWKKV